MSEDDAGRLAPLPRRVVDSPDDGEVALDVAPDAFVVQLLERAEVLLATLDADVRKLREEQAAEILRIEAEAGRKQEAYEEAAALLTELLDQGRELAQRKGKAELLQAGMQAAIDPRRVRQLPRIIDELRSELRAAEGITGAIRMEPIGRLLLEANLAVEILKHETEKAKAALIEETARDLDKESTEASASFGIGSDLLRRDLDRLEAVLPPPARSFDGDGWRGWDPPDELVPWLRVGSFTRDGMDDLGIPWIAPTGSFAGLYVDPGERAAAATRAVHAVVLRLLAALPPGGARLTLVDPVGLGATFAPFLRLAEQAPELLDGGVVANVDDIQPTLERLAEHVERVHRQLLRGVYASLAEADAAAGEVLEPHRIVVLAGYPQGITTEGHALLTRLVEQGPAAGLILLVVRDPTYRVPRGGPRTVALPGLARITAADDGLRHETEDAGTWRFVPDELPAPAETGRSLVDRILTLVADRARGGLRHTVTPAMTWRLLAEARAAGVRPDLPVTSAVCAPGDPASWWTGDLRPGLAVPVGRQGVRDVATLRLADGDLGSTLLVGGPGDGVGDLLTAVVTGLSLLYDPRALTMELVCLGQRATFAPAATAGLPHATLVADNAERELGLAVLERLVQRLGPGPLPAAAPDGEGDDDGDDGGPAEGRRRLLVLDGVEELLATEDQTGRRAAQLIEQLVQEGPDQGVHLVLAARCPAGDDELGPAQRTLERLPLDVIGTRVVLPAPAPIVDRFVARDDDGELPSVADGEALVCTGPLGSGRARPVRLVELTSRDRYRMLRGVRDVATRRGIARRPQIHDGAAATRLELSPLHRLLQHPEQREQRRVPRLWLGEPVTLGDPVEVLLRRQDGANLLVVGEDAEATVGMVLAAVTSGVLVHGSAIRFDLLDFTPLESGLTEAAQAFSEHWPVAVERRRNLVKVLDSVHRIVQDRHAAGQYDEHPVVLVLAGVDRARDLGDSPRPGDVDPAELVATLLRDGPEVGVHLVATAATLEGFERRLGSGALREFALRVALPMGEAESEALLDSAAAGGLRAHQALLHDEDWGRLVRFRPYLPAPVSWLTGLARAAAGVDPSQA